MPRITSARDAEADELLRVAVRACCVDFEDVFTGSDTAERDFDLRWDVENVMAVIEKRVDATRAGYYRRSMVSPIPCPVMTLLINDEIALMGMPGEPFVQFGLDFRARAPVPAAFFVGYANGYYAYFPTIKAAVEGGYGADSLTTRTQVGAGEAMVDHAVIKLYQMLGRLKDAPAVPAPD